MKFAPLLILTLNRDLHFKNCIESLSKCESSKKTDLFIALDYPLNDSHFKGYNKILKIIDNIKGFKSLNIIKRDVNFGIPLNFEDAMKQIFNEYDRVILSEDDNIFAPSFLNFVNKGLELYEKRKDIFSVSGYNHPFKIPSWYKDHMYLRQDFTGWGVGLWKDKWYDVDTSLENFHNMFFNNYMNINKYHKKAMHQLIHIKVSNRIYVNANVVSMNDGLLLLNIIDKKMYSVYPVNTRVINKGLDGTGARSNINGNIIYRIFLKYFLNENKVFLKQNLYNDNTEDIFLMDLQPKDYINKFIYKQNQPSLIHRLILLIPRSIKKWMKIKLITRFTKT